MQRKLLALVSVLTAILLIGCGQAPVPTTAPTSAASTQSPDSTEPTAESADVTQEVETGDPATDAPPAATATPEPPFPGEGPWEVSFSAADGSPLQGTVYGQGTTAVVLAPMYTAGQESWTQFAQDLAAQGYRVMTFDYRGYGASEGSRDPATAADDLTGAVAYLRGHEFAPVVLIGAGLGGSAAIRVASQDNTIAGAALISAPRTYPPESASTLSITDTELAALSVPTLWLGTRFDMTQNAEEMFAAAGGSDKELWIYEGSGVQGTYIFEGADGANLRQRLIEFVARVVGA